MSNYIINSYIGLDGKARKIKKIYQQWGDIRVEFIPLIRATWEKLPSNGIGGTGKCSNCNTAIYGYKTMKYCPECGAQMEDD